MSSVTILLLFVFLVLPNLITSADISVLQNICVNTANYTSGSTYQANLSTMLSSLYMNMDETGFYNASFGQNPNTVYTLVLCRGDLQLDMCRICVQNVSVNLIAACPNQRQAASFDPLCMLRYSGEPMFMKFAVYPRLFTWMQENVSSTDKFKEDLRILLPSLWNQASQGGPLRKVAAGNRPTADFQTIYAFVQCTPDLTSEECTNCLIGAAQQLPICCDSRRWANIYRASCNLRYDTLQPFYNISRLRELDRTPTPPASPPTLPTRTKSPSPQVKGQLPVCGTTGNYTIGSAYGITLNNLLSLSTNVDQNGFYNASLGGAPGFPDTVYMTVHCRGDLQLDVCRSCIQHAAEDVMSKCPNQRKADYWSGSPCPICILRYSDQPLLWKWADYPAYHCGRSLQNVSSPVQFNADLRILLENTRDQAAQGGPLRKIAAGNKTTADNQTIYLLAQCTPDLTLEDCTFCLNWNRDWMGGCCESSRQILIIRPSCTLQYSISTFYNETRLLELAINNSTLSPSPTASTLPDFAGYGGSKTRTIIIIVAVSVVVGLLLLIFAVFLLIKKTKQKPNILPDTTEETGYVESLQYQFDELREATADFSEANKLGRGAFGPVYWGKLHNGLQIAVKRLSMPDNSDQGDMEYKNKEFKNEVKLLVNLQHVNLVRLLGFSIERKEKLLVYEFLQNSSLDRFIFDPTRRSTLDWSKRNNIIKGIARGLLYLHRDSRLRIIHRDLKAGNILLDDDMNPKIADFGTARIFSLDETIDNTSRIVGTFGYIAPEYAELGEISVKLDVYSFGVLVLETISGQRNKQDGENGVALLTSAAWRNWHEGTPSDLVDPVLTGRLGVPADISRYIHIGMLCIQQSGDDRPTMASVVQMLDGYPSTLPAPKGPTFFVASNYNLEDSNDTLRLIQEKRTRTI